MTYFASMYFKISMRPNPAIGFISGYYRLVESYRNSNDRVCHRTILNVGFLDGVSTEKGVYGKWKVLLTTDTRISFSQLIEIYQTRGSIEVFFKESETAAFLWQGLFIELLQVLATLFEEVDEMAVFQKIVTDDKAWARLKALFACETSLNKAA